jgi:hypothetical protein
VSSALRPNSLSENLRYALERYVKWVREKNRKKRAVFDLSFQLVLVRTPLGYVEFLDKFFIDCKNAISGGVDDLAIPL